ncbi:hypothetical protein [Sulfurimonas hydrogeniphila]|uniref:hypothetical protein n=1 Tax=Sulfurimonas hydrogeniphila TaxID=2509341 RepID=UPI00125FE5F1|nr:hypothetical protein [Sulfurimonas hydrogeniphila]
MSNFLHLNNYIALLAENHLLRKLNLQDIYRADIEQTKYKEYLLMETQILKNKLIQMSAFYIASIAFSVMLIIIL